MGNQVCPCKASPVLPVCHKLGSPCSDASSSSSSWAGTPSGALDSFAFSALDLTGYDLGQAAYHLLLEPLQSCKGSRTSDLDGFVRRVQQGYLPNVFHGFHHAVDVLQMVILLGRLMPWEVLLEPSQRLALAVAALAHDVGHPGFSNVFLVEVCDELAVRYNDISPLENMHCSKLFEILRTKDADIFANFSRRELRPLRKLMIDAILHTDTARYGTLTAALDLLNAEHQQAFAFAGDTDYGLTKKMSAIANDEQKALLASALLHTADLSYACRRWSLAYSWSLRAQEELYLQGDQERTIGLPVQPLNDRKTARVPAGQLGFIHAVVAPLVSAEVRLFRSWQELATSLAANTQEWAAKIDRGVEEKVDSRANEVRAMLESAVQGRPESKSSSATTTGTMGEEPCSEPSCNNFCEAVVPTTPLVREVRRWQEVRADGPSRELVLLYVVSEAAAPGGAGPGQRGQPILFRYAVKEEHELTEASFGPPAAALLALDANCTHIGSEGFEGLLADFLHNERGRHASSLCSEEQSNTLRNSAQSGPSWRNWLTSFGPRLTSSAGVAV